eukprot:COSAG01_NODE_6049_length_3880_cov_7.107643_1_plen_71_part_00
MQSVLGSPNISYNNTYYAPYTPRLARPTGKPQFNELDTPLQEKRCVTLIWPARSIRTGVCRESCLWWADP